MKKKVVLAVSVVLLLAMVTAMCVACTPNSDNVEKKLKDNGYKVEVVEAPEDAAENVKATKTLVAYKKELSLTTFIPDLTITWYKDSKSAKEAYKEAQENLDDLKALVGTDTYEVKKKGNAVIVGTKEAIKFV